jgi:hypothetical protein
LEGRIVICFRSAGGPGRGFLERARALDGRARAAGGVLVAWGPSRVSYAFDPGALAPALALALVRGDDTKDEEAPFAVGVAQGDLRRFAEDGSRGDLAWGAPLVAASLLASVTKPGEIACAETVRALREGELVTAGARVARKGSLRVRGARLDRRCPWRKDAVERLSQMRVAALVGADPLRAQCPAGNLLLLRADPGTGGTRRLTELAAKAPRALLVSPSGSGFEPLGALRRALARSITKDLAPPLAELADSLARLLSGDGISLDVASRLVSAFLWRNDPAPQPSMLLIDDAKAIDPASLEACVRATRAPKAPFVLVARLDATGGLPSVLAAVPKAAESEILPLAQEAAEALAGGCTNEALDAEGRKRWARLGGNLPLGIVEAIAYGIVTGDIAWEGGRATPRSRASGRGKVRPPSEWILIRAREENAACRTLLGLLAMLGGEAKIERLARILAQAGERVDVEAAVAELVRARWLVDTQEDWVGLPSRTRRDTLTNVIEEPARKKLHAAAADVIRSEEGVFGQVEAAWQAAQAGDGRTASQILLTAAKRTADARLEASTTQLIAFARRADPSCEDAAMELLANALARSPSVAPPAPAPRPGIVPRAALPPSPRPRIESTPPPKIEIHDSEPPTFVRADAASSQGEASPSSVPGASIATRLGELAKEALLSADNAALERWVDGLRAAGESPIFTERLRAMARLGRGDIGDALRVLRRTRAQLDPADLRQRCQTSLALGVALSVAGRPQDALLEGLDALARARQNGDARGAQACLAFLAKLYTAVQRPDEAEKLRAAPPWPT